MKYIQLYQDGKEMLGSDGVMKVDGRLSAANIYKAVRSRNNNIRENFPHKIATSYSICNGPAWNNPGRQNNI